jgi:hypothetical protein
MCPMSVEDCLLVNPLNSDRHDANHPATSLLDTDHHTSSLLDTNRSIEGRLDASCHNADCHNVDHRGADLHNADHHDAVSHTLFIEGTENKDDNPVTGADNGGFEASNAGGESHPKIMMKNHAEMHLAGAGCSAGLWSERN